MGGGARPKKARSIPDFRAGLAFFGLGPPPIIKPITYLGEAGEYRGVLGLIFPVPGLYMGLLGL